MSDDKKKELRDLKIAALAAAGTIAVFFFVYWVVQIQDVREMLALAYGQFGLRLRFSTQPQRLQRCPRGAI